MPLIRKSWDSEKSDWIIITIIRHETFNANGSATGNPDMARAELIQHHLGILDQLNTPDKPIFGDLFVGQGEDRGQSVRAAGIGVEAGMQDHALAAA